MVNLQEIYSLCHHVPVGAAWAQRFEAQPTKLDLDKVGADFVAGFSARLRGSDAAAPGEGPNTSNPIRTEAGRRTFGGQLKRPVHRRTTDGRRT